MAEPQDNGNSGRNNKGQFVNGHDIGHEPGKHPNTKKSQKLRQALLDAVTEKDMQDIVKKVVELAKGGNIQAIKEVFDRCLGKPEQPITGSEGGPIPITIVDYANAR